MARNQVTGRAPVVLGVLFAGAFVMGCAEMLVVGLIDLIAADLNVSVPAAGALVTANALGLAVGGPLLTPCERPVRPAAGPPRRHRRLRRREPAARPRRRVRGLPRARVVIGAVQGLFIAAGITTATSVVPPERAGRAMAVVITGFASASALGLPLGTLLGQAVGWRGSFTAVVGIAVAVLVAAAVVLPPVRPTAGSGSLGRARAAFAPPVLAVLALCFVLFAAIQAALTYLVPFLDEVTGVTGPAVGALPPGLRRRDDGRLLPRRAVRRHRRRAGPRRRQPSGSPPRCSLLGVLGSNPVAAAVAVAGHRTVRHGLRPVPPAPGRGAGRLRRGRSRRPSPRRRSTPASPRARSWEGSPSTSAGSVPSPPPGQRSPPSRWRSPRPPAAWHHRRARPPTIPLTGPGRATLS